MVRIVSYINLSHSFLSNKMESFYAEPMLESLNLLKKKDIIDVASHYKLEVPENTSKSIIKKLVLDYLVGKDLITKSETSDALKVSNYWN